MGIKHYSDLTEAENTLLKSYIESKVLPEVSIKVDGSANIGFGVDDDNKVYVARNVKGQNTKVYDISVYPLTPQYNAIRTAASAILNSSDTITAVLKPGDYANAEILYEATPNVITYDGANYIFIHDNRFAGLDDKVFTSTIDVCKLVDVSTDISQAEIGKFTETNDFIVKSNKSVRLQIPYNKHRTSGILLPSSESISRLFDISPLSSMWPTEAKPFHEGVVVEYPNLIFKVVGDFPKLNKAQWKIREYMEDGYTDEAGWVYGLRYQYFEEIADVIGLPLLKAPSRKHYINKNYGGCNFFDRVLELLEEKEIVATDNHISVIHTLTTTFINSKLADVRSLIWDATYLQDINYRKTLESYVCHSDFYHSAESFIGSVHRSNKKNNEKLAAIICFMLKEDVVKDTLLKKIGRFLSGKNKQA